MDFWYKTFFEQKCVELCFFPLLKNSQLYKSVALCFLAALLCLFYYNFLFLHHQQSIVYCHAKRSIFLVLVVNVNFITGAYALASSPKHSNTYGVLFKAFSYCGIMHLYTLIVEYIG